MIWLLHVNDRVRKLGAKVSPGGWIKFVKTLWMRAYGVYESLKLAVKPNPKLRLVLCEPFTLPVGKRKEGYDTWRAGIQARQDVVAKLAMKHDAALARFQQVFDAACKAAPAEHWIWDGVHPTYSGHQLMADEWERTVRAKWPGP